MPSRLVEALDLALVRRAAGTIPGEHRSPGAGLGTELAQLREYQPGDDVRQLDAAASARTGAPHVRLQVPERLMTAWIVLDVSPSMAFGTGERLKSDVAAGVATRARPARSAARRSRGAGPLRRRAERVLSAAQRPARVGAHRARRARRASCRTAAATRAAWRARSRASAGLRALPGLVAVVSDFRGGGLEPPAARARRSGTRSWRSRSATRARRRCPRPGRCGSWTRRPARRWRSTRATSACAERYAERERRGARAVRDAAAGRYGGARSCSPPTRRGSTDLGRRLR